MTAETSLPLKPVRNELLTSQVGEPVLLIDVLPVKAEDVLQVAFKGQKGSWRQGIWLGVNGKLEVAGVRGDQLTIWTDTAPSSFEVKVLETKDGLLRLYNVWDSGRGRRRESQSHTSGMLKHSAEGRITYRSNDIGFEPAFDKLVFEVTRR